jgi:hypothetical protein
MAASRLLMVELSGNSSVDSRPSIISCANEHWYQRTDQPGEMLIASSPATQLKCGSHFIWHSTSRSTMPENISNALGKSLMLLRIGGYNAANRSVTVSENL